MSHNFKTIVPLKSGTTAIMLSKYNNLVRTGVPLVRSSFIHAILTSYSKRYRDMDGAAKENYVNVLRSKIGADMSISRWLNEIDSTHTIILIQNRIRKMFIKIYLHLNNKIHESKIDIDIMNIIAKVITPYKDYFQTISSIMPIKILDKKHLNNIFKDIVDSIDDASCLPHGTNPYKKIMETYKTKIKIYLDDRFTEQLNTLPDVRDLNKTIYTNFQIYFNKLTNAIINSAEESTFENFKNILTDPDYEIAPDMFRFFSNYFKRNLLFIDSSDRKPVDLACSWPRASATQRSQHPPPTRYTKTLILLYIKNNQPSSHEAICYESIGLIDHKHRISREYKKSSDTVQLIIEDLHDGPSSAEILDSSFNPSLDDIASPASERKRSRKLINPPQEHDADVDADADADIAVDVIPSDNNSEPISDKQFIIPIPSQINHYENAGGADTLYQSADSDNEYSDTDADDGADGADGDDGDDAAHN